MGAVMPKKVPRAKRRGDDRPVKKFSGGGSANDYSDVPAATLNQRIDKKLLAKYGGDRAAVDKAWKSMGSGQLLALLDEDK